MRYRCNTCQGEYDDQGKDGSLYFHACPPIQRARVKRGEEELELDLEQALETDQVLERFAIERPDARDENRNPNDRDERGRAQIRSEGKGRTALERR